jgi:hypothetical protein
VRDWPVPAGCSRLIERAETASRESPKTRCTTRAHRTTRNGADCDSHPGGGALDDLVERREVRGDAHGKAAQTVSDSGAMKRADLIALASPPCHECGAPVQRVETRWHLDEDCRWRPGPYFMVCADEHRVLVLALE